MKEGFLGLSDATYMFCKVLDKRYPLQGIWLLRIERHRQVYKSKIFKKLSSLFSV